MPAQDLAALARAMFAPGTGVLAGGESLPNDEALEARGGNKRQFRAGRAAFSPRARLDSTAWTGSYNPQMDAA